MTLLCDNNQFENWYQRLSIVSQMFKFTGLTDINET